MYNGHLGCFTTSPLIKKTSVFGHMASGKPQSCRANESWWGAESLPLTLAADGAAPLERLRGGLPPHPLRRQTGPWDSTLLTEKCLSPSRPLPRGLAQGWLTLKVPGKRLSVMTQGHTLATPSCLHCLWFPASWRSSRRSNPARWVLPDPLRPWPCLCSHSSPTPRRPSFACVVPCARNASPSPPVHGGSFSPPSKAG